MQTLAQSGYTKTGSFHDLRQRPVHEEGSPHYGAKRKTHIKHDCKSDDFRAGFKVAKWGMFCYPSTLQTHPDHFNQV
jgi:hypothetical protein